MKKWDFYELVFLFFLHITDSRTKPLEEDRPVSWKYFVYICSYHGMQEASQTPSLTKNPGHYLSFAITL